MVQGLCQWNYKNMTGWGEVDERWGAEMGVTRTHFAYRIDTSTAESVVEHVAGRVEDYQVARATLAWRPHHVAAGCASDRGQPAPALGLV
jgi:hypothetical protein